MFHWKTNDLVEELKKLPGVDKIKVLTQPGDYDTVRLAVYPQNCKRECFFVTGYPSTNIVCNTPNDALCEMIEISDGLDSQGGLNSEKVEMIRLYAELRIFFRHEYVIDSVDVYF